MKLFRISLLLLMVGIIALSCNPDETEPDQKDETQDLIKVSTFTEDDYKVELFTQSGQLYVGYNQIYLRVSNQDKDYINDASIHWEPMMTMEMGGMTHKHGCPSSEVLRIDGTETLYGGYIIFSMATVEPDDVWDLTLHLSVNGDHAELSEEVKVNGTETEFNKNFISTTGNDGHDYLLAMIEPTDPDNGSNDIVVALYMSDHDTGEFSIVNDYEISIDPRMPGMGNHSAPGNEDMTQGNDGFYHGKVGFSMSGFWVINMIMEDASGTVVKGEEITGDHPESSLHFKLEF